jgi:hypothetical protein
LAPPLCRSCRKLVRKACNAAVPEGEVAAADVPLDAAAEVALDALVDAELAVVPPRSAISLVNAAFNFVRAGDEEFADVPVALVPDA